MQVERLRGVAFRRAGNPKTHIDSATNKRRTYSYNLPVARCRVSFADQDGILHAVEVDADSLYEAVAHAVAEFRAAVQTRRHLVRRPSSHSPFIGSPSSTVFD